MKNEVKLLPCPFCGGEAKMQRIINLDDFDDFFIMCEKCFSRTKKFKAERSAILVWNTRKPMEGIIDYLEEFMEKQYDSYNNAKRTGNIRQMDYSDGCAEGLIEAIEIVKEEGGIE